MEILRQEGSLTTPGIVFDPFKGLIELRGKSIPENSFEFYEPLYEWLDEYQKQPQPNTSVDLYMEYFNTSSSKEFIRFFKRLEDLNKSGKTSVKITWYYESDDEEMMEMGDSLQKEVELPIEIIAVDEM